MTPCTSPATPSQFPLLGPLTLEFLGTQSWALLPFHLLYYPWSPQEVSWFLCCLYPDDSHIYISSPDLSPKPQTKISICQSNITIWVSIKHLRLNRSTNFWSRSFWTVSSLRCSGWKRHLVISFFHLYIRSCLPYLQNIFWIHHFLPAPSLPPQGKP